RGSRERVKPYGRVYAIRPRPGRRHPGHARLLDILAQQRGADDSPIATNLVGRTLRHAAEQYRIVAIVDSLDVERGFGPQVAGVIAGPFAERAFDTLVIALDETLEHDLGIGRDRQPGDGRFDDLDGLAAHAAHDLILAHPVGHLARGHQESHGIAAADHGDRHRRAARLVLVAHLAAVLAGRDVEARGLGVVDHHAIGAAVDPALVGIAGDVEAAGADVAAAVVRVPFGRREGGDVDVVSGH